MAYMSQEPIAMSYCIINDFEFGDINRSNLWVNFITNYRPTYLA